MTDRVGERNGGCTETGGSRGTGHLVRDRQTDRETGGETDRQTDKQRQTDRQAGKQAGRETDRQTDSGRQADRRTDRHRQTDRQTELFLGFQGPVKCTGLVISGTNHTAKILVLHDFQICRKVTSQKLGRSSEHNRDAGNTLCNV